MTLRSWRERLQEPLKAPEDDSGRSSSSANTQSPITADSLRVSLCTDAYTNHTHTDQTSPTLSGMGRPSPESRVRRPISVPYPLPVRWGRERGDIAVQDPETGEWHELAYADATPVWQAALRRREGKR